MVFRKGFLLAIVLLAIVSYQNCEAATWTQIGQVQDKESIVGYIDKGSVQDVSSFFSPQDKYEIWEKWTFSPPRVMNTKVVPEILYLTQYKKNHQYCVREIWYVYADEARQKNSFSCEYQRVVPDSINELVWKYIFKTYVPALQ